MNITISFYYTFIFQPAVIVSEGRYYLSLVRQNRKIVNVIDNSNDRLWDLFDFPRNLGALVVG